MLDSRATLPLENHLLYSQTALSDALNWFYKDNDKPTRFGCCTTLRNHYREILGQSQQVHVDSGSF